MRSRRSDIWLGLAFALPVLHAAVYALLQARPGVIGAILWYVVPPLSTLAAIGVLVLALVDAVSSRLTWNRRRVIGYAALSLSVLMPLAYRTYPSSRDSEPSVVRFQLPLDGPVTVIWGGDTPSVNYHVVLPDQRWAYDLTVTSEGRSFLGDGSRTTDYHAYARPILVPAPGIVRRSFDGDPDMPPGTLGGGTNPCGNHVVLEVARNEFLFICHMQPRSVQVRVGDRVARGDQIGRVGNSGNTSEPHVHVHLQTTARTGLAEGIPMYFHDYRVDGRFVERGMPTGGSRKQVVERAAAPDADRSSRTRSRTRAAEHSSDRDRPPQPEQSGAMLPDSCAGCGAITWSRSIRRTAWSGRSISPRPGRRLACERRTPIRTTAARKRDCS